MSPKSRTYYQTLGGARPEPPKPREPEAVPVPAPSRSRWTDPPWNGKHVYIAWGLRTGDFTPTWIAARAQASGCRLLVIQDEPGNEPYQAVIKQALHARGLAYGTWGVPDAGTYGRVAEYQPDCYLADVETTIDYTSWVDVFDQSFPDLPRALVATGGLGGPEQAAAWVPNWDLTMQDYVRGPNAANQTPDHGDNFAYWRHFPLIADGVHHHYPVLEVNAEGSQELAPQLPLVKPWGKSFGVYSAEYMTDLSWQALGSV